MAFLAAAAVLVGFSLTAFWGDGKDLMIQITARDQVLLYPLSVDRTVDIEGPLGISRVSIENDTVRMVSSPCPDQLCLHVGDIHKAGRWIACLPNQVFVRILGQEGGDLDAKSY